MSESPASRRKRPRRYLPPQRCVRLWHEYHAQEFGDSPTLIWLSLSAGLSVSCVHRWCVAQGLPLSQTHAAKPRTPSDSQDS